MGPRHLAAVLAVGALAVGCGQASSSEPAPAETTGTAQQPAVSQAGAVLKEWADAFGRGDVEAAMARSTGPVQVFLAYVDASAHVLGEPIVPENLNVTTLLDDGREAGDSVVFAGPMGYGSSEPGAPPPRILTQIELVQHDDSWAVDRFLRNEIPIQDFVATPSAEHADTADGLNARVVSVFRDRGCDIDPDCPHRGDQRTAIALTFTNDRDGRVEPVGFWLETDDGRVDPADGGATELSPGSPAWGVAFFDGFDFESEAVLRLQFTDGTDDISLSLPIPQFTHQTRDVSS